MEYLVTLVHGTFAPNAPWAKKDSKFCTLLAQRIKANVEFESFKWTGANRHTTRVSEAVRLTEILKQQHINYPGKKKIIIAHSHGGNIAMYALKMAKDISKDFGLVTMATPFLNSEKRAYDKSLHMNLVMLPVVFCIFLLILFGVSFFYLLDYLPFLNQLGDYGILLFGCCEFIFVMLCFDPIGPFIYKFLKARADLLPDKLDQLIAHVGINNLDNSYPILAVVDRSDEIKLWFGNLYRIWELILDVHEFMVSAAKWMVALTFISLLIVVGLFVINADYFQHKNTFFLNTYVYIGTVTLFLCLSIPWLTFSIPFVFFLIKSNPLVLGWESWIHQMFIRTTPAITPIGYQKTTLIQYHFKKENFFSLKHSIYEKDIVISDIGTWISNL